MNLLRRIERLLDNFGLVFKGVLIVVWLLWSVQLIVPLRSAVKEEVENWKYYRERDLQAERKEGLETLRLVNGMIAQAEKEGTSYSPKRYFEDLRVLKEKEAGCSSVFPSIVFTSSTQLQQVVIKNIKKGFYSQKDISEEACIYKDWLEESSIGSDREHFYGEIRKITWRDCLSWLFVLYFRTISLVILYYLVRMAQRRGILETILAEKRRFVLAVFLWPIYFTKYPFNVIREIRVEAELRRLKGLFRILSVRENQLIRKVANSSDYYSWLVQYHRQNRRRFKRGVVLALVGTIVFHILLPFSVARSSEKRARDSTSIVCETAKQVQHSQNLKVDDGSRSNHQTEESGLVPEPDFTELQLLVGLVLFKEEICLSRWPEPIDHVPFSLLFGRLVWSSINQAVLKGWKHEYENELVGCGRDGCFRREPICC